MNDPHSSPRVFGALAALTATLLVNGCASQPSVILERSAYQPIPAAQELRDACAEPTAEALDSIVRVSTHDGIASGVVIAPNLVLTAAHVVEGAPAADVALGADGHGPRQRAAIVASDPYQDLALLMVEGGNLKPLVIRRTAPRTNEPVWAVGYPLALARATTTGHVHRVVDGKLYASASIESGNSGGGLLGCHDGRFELLGMVRSYGAYMRGDVYIKIEDLSISVPAARITDFVYDHGFLL